MSTTGSAAKKSSINRFHQALVQLGIDVDALYGQLSIDSDRIAREDASLTMTQYFALLNLASESSGRRFLAAELALAMDNDDLGILAYLIRNARHFEHALDILRRHIELLSPGAVISLVERQSEYILSYSFSTVSPAACYQDVEGTLVQFVCMIRKLLGDGHWQPRCIYFSHAARNDDDAVKFPVGEAVVFDHSLSGVVFHRDILRYPIENSDSKLLALLETQVLRASRELPSQSSLPDRVRLLIASGLNNNATSSEEIASALGMSRRTLLRRLQGHGTSFRNLRETLIVELGKTSLVESSTPVARIAQELGYSDSSAFNRAFKRLAGFTPLKYRKLHSRGN